MKNIFTALFVCSSDHGYRRAGSCTNLSDASDNDDCSLPGRRAERCSSAHHGRRHEQGARSEHRHRKCGRRRGTIGTGRAAGSEHDGYTLLAASMGSHVSAPALYANLKYNSTKDFEPIGLTANAPAVVVARKDFPAKDFSEFVAYLKKSGDSVKQAHGGVGSSSHMACLLFTAELGLKPNLVAYRGTGPALNDVIGGHVDFFCEQVVSVQGAIRGGTVKAFVVSGNDRSPALPDVPSAKEVGAKDYQINIWSAIFAPKDTPKPIVDKLSDALNKALDDPAVAKRLLELGGTAPPTAERGSAYLANLLKTDIARWNPILKAAAEKTN